MSAERSPAAAGSSKTTQTVSCGRSGALGLLMKLGWPRFGCAETTPEKPLSRLAGAQRPGPMSTNLWAASPGERSVGLRAVGRAVGRSVGLSIGRGAGVDLRPSSCEAAQLWGGTTGTPVMRVDYMDTGRNIKQTRALLGVRQYNGLPQPQLFRSVRQVASNPCKHVRTTHTQAA